MSGFKSRSGHADNMIIITSAWNVKVDDILIVGKN